VQIVIFAVGSWITCAAFGPFIDRYALAGLIERVWPVVLATVYLPMLYLVLRRPPTSGMPRNFIPRLLRRLHSDLGSPRRPRLLSLS